MDPDSTVHVFGGTCWGFLATSIVGLSFFSTANVSLIVRVFRMVRTGTGSCRTREILVLVTIGDHQTLLKIYIIDPKCTTDFSDRREFFKPKHYATPEPLTSGCCI